MAQNILYGTRKTCRPKRSLDEIKNINFYVCRLKILLNQYCMMFVYRIRYIRDLRFPIFRGFCSPNEMYLSGVFEVTTKSIFGFVFVQLELHQNNNWR